jgi:hypothetical protein
MRKMTQKVGQMQTWTEYDQMVNQECYLGALTRLREYIPRKRPEVRPNKWILHHDNAPAHDALRGREFLAKKSITKIDPPTYTPDSAPAIFWDFPKVKMFPSLRNFNSVDIINTSFSHHTPLNKTNSAACSPQGNYTDRATAACLCPSPSPSHIATDGQSASKSCLWPTLDCFITCTRAE